MPPPMERIDTEEDDVPRCGFGKELQASVVASASRGFALVNEGTSRIFRQNWNVGLQQLRVEWVLKRVAGKDATPGTTLFPSDLTKGA